MNYEQLTIGQTNMSEHSFWEMLKNLPPPTPEELANEEKRKEEELEKEEEEARKKRHLKAAERYEETLKRSASPEEEKSDKKSGREDEIITEIHRPSGLKSRRTSRGWERGHRHGLKKERPKGGETIRQKEAA